MYKRPPSKNAFQYKEPKSKMRKLNVSLTGASNQNSQSNPTNVVQLQRPSTSTAHLANGPPHPTSSSATSNRKPDAVAQRNNVPPPVPPANDENLWGDADDEFILIASQMVDNMDMDAVNQQIIVQSMNMSQSNVIEVKVPNVEQDVVKHLMHFTEEDDRLFSEINNFDVIGNPHLHGTLPPAAGSNIERPVSPSVFKVPDRRAPIQTSTQIDMNLSFRPHGHPQSTQFSQNIEIPQPIVPTTEPQAESQNLKVKFLTQKQGDLRKEIEHLQFENQRITELCQTKDGESSLLRSENERLKNQFDNMRKEKSNEISKVRNDLSMKMSDLEKTILDLKSQLQFKEMSSMHQQSRKSICTQQSQSIVRQASESFLQDWEKFKLPSKSLLPVQAVRPVDPRLYISSKLSDSYWVSTSDKKQWELLNRLQLLLADLMSNNDFSNKSQSKLLDETFRLALTSAKEMYVASENGQIDPKKNDVTCTHSDVGRWMEYSIVSEDKLFHREEAFLSRRILACVATICERFPQFSSMLFHCNIDDNAASVMDLLSLTMKNFSYYKNVENYQGVIESSCHLLTILADNDNTYNSQSATNFASILHNILLCRPGIGSLEKISKFLELMSCRTESKTFLNALCCRKNTGDITEPQGYIKYSDDSCTLQIYALLMRLYILPHESMNLSVKQLTAITQSTLLFMRYSLLQSPKWLCAEKRGNCLCRARMFGVIITLLYVYLLHWIEHPSEIDSHSVSAVSRFGMEFLYDNLVKHYDDDVLNSGGTIIKNRIRMVVEWLNLYDFKFKPAHQHALQSVCLQRLGPMVEYLRYNKNITSKHSAEATEVYNDVVETFFDTND